jgi:hypothetical protein
VDDSNQTTINIMVGELIPNKTIDYEFQFQSLSGKLRIECYKLQEISRY